MAGEIALLKVVLDLVGAERVLRGAKSAWEKSRWAKDSAKVNAVERKIDTLSHEVARLARHLSSEAIAPETARMLDRFQVDLEELGLTKEEAIDLRRSVAVQIQSSVLEPVADARLLQDRMETLEAENLDLLRRVKLLEPLAEKTSNSDSKSSAAQIFAVVALVLAATSIFGTLAVAIIRR
jgi:hypothetical protein